MVNNWLKTRFKLSPTGLMSIMHVPLSPGLSFLIEHYRTPKNQIPTIALFVNLLNIRKPYLLTAHFFLGSFFMGDKISGSDI